MTDHREAVEAARRIVEANDNRDSFPDGRPQWSKDLENISRALLSLSDRVEEARKEERERCAAICGEFENWPQPGIPHEAGFRYDARDAARTIATRIRSLSSLLLEG